MKHTHIAPTALLALLLAALATGCSSSHGSASPADRTPGSPGSSGPATASASTSSSSSPRPTLTPVPISAWPKTISPVASVPKLVQQQAIHAGYTGDDYIRKLASKWHITMSKKHEAVLSGMPKHGFSSIGVVHPDTEAALTLGPVWDSDGDLLLINCVATGSAPQAREFLHDCTTPDFPGAERTDTATWMDSTEQQLAKAHKNIHGVVVSPMHRTGPTATFMTEYADAQYGDTYTAEVIGVVS